MGDKLNILEVNNNALLLTPLKIIPVPGGDVLHAMKYSDKGFTGFGEAYFSTIEPGIIKAWKRHRKMTLNLIVPFGAIRFTVEFFEAYRYYTNNRINLLNQKPFPEVCYWMLNHLECPAV